MMKKTLITCALLALFVGSAALAEVRLGPSASGVTICTLDPTQAGFAVSASGKARLTSGTRGEAIAVKVAADLADKTMLIVPVQNREGKQYDVGAIYMNFGIGSWEAQTWKDGSKAFPIGKIASIGIREGNSMLLFGHCGGTTVELKD